MAVKNIKHVAVAAVAAAVMSGCTVQTEDEVSNAKQVESVDVVEVQEAEAPSTIAYAVTDRTGEVEIALRFDEGSEESQVIETVIEGEEPTEAELDDVVDELFGAELAEEVVDEPVVVEAVEEVVETPVVDEVVEVKTYIQVFASAKAEAGELVVADVMSETGKEASVVKVGEFHKVIVGPYEPEEVEGALAQFKEMRDYKTAFVTDLQPKAE